MNAGDVEAQHGDPLSRFSWNALFVLHLGSHVEEYPTAEKGVKRSRWRISSKGGAAWAAATFR
jgi:hypothetical protein